VLSPDGGTAYTTDRKQDVIVWDLSGRHRLDRPFTAGTGFPGWPWFALSPDGRLLAVPSSPEKHFNENGSIRLLDTRSMRTIRRIRYPDGSPQALSFSPDARTLAVTSVSDQHDPDARLWDVATGHPVATLRGIAEGQRLVAIRFSPDGTLLVGGGTAQSGGTVTIWRPGTPDRPPDTFHTRGTVEDVAFTPDGSQLVVSTGWGKGGDFVIWDVGTGRVVKSVPADDSGVWTSTVAADGRTLMTGGQTGAVRLWSLPAGAPLGPPLNGLTGGTVSAGLTPDGRTALGSDTSGNAVLWDVAGRSMIGDALPGPQPNRFAAAAFTPDGTHVIVVSDTGAGWVWDIDPTDWLARACAVAGRNFTQQEWQQILPDRAYQPTCRS
jgi:WD40 repeat protein